MFRLAFADIPRPRLVHALRHYTWPTAAADALAGITVGFVALPLAIAFAIASGVPPQAGLYCAIVAGALISVFGGSRVQIGGPTGAFVIIVAGIVASHGIDGLLVCTMMAGGILIALGLTGMGSAVRFIPRPVVVGFTNGIAVLIASTQLRDFFGLRLASEPTAFLPRLRALAEHAGSWSPAATAVSVGALALLILGTRISRRIPAPILVLVAGTAAVPLLGLPVETIGTRFGGLPGGFPSLRLPHVPFATLSSLVMPAVTVAMLGAIESLMSATVADRMSGDRHNPNVELVAQGLANLASPIVGGLPATGAIARTATNIRSGARTPVAGIVHAATLLVILLYAAPLARFIPLGILAAILLVVAYNMGEWREIPELLRLTGTDVAVWVVTFALT
ncbi:MAG: SulP family inorganic anion transporter, partial [Acidobacteriota bacterium]